MATLVISFVSAVTGAGYAEGDDEKITIIVPRSHAYLADLLARAFEGREDVEVIVDRRRGERRTQQRSIAAERRGKDRRRRKEEVIEVIVGKIGQAGWPSEGSS